MCLRPRTMGMCTSVHLGPWHAQRRQLRFGCAHRTSQFWHKVISTLKDSLVACTHGFDHVLSKVHESGGGSISLNVMWQHMSMSMTSGTAKLVAASHTLAQKTLVCGYQQAVGFSLNFTHVCFLVHACTGKITLNSVHFNLWLKLESIQLFDKQRFSHFPGLLLSQSF